jgi:hypothetical protein
MFAFRLRVQWLGAAALIAVTPRANAQVAGALGAFIGYYRPFGSFDPASVYSTDLPNQPSDLQGLAAGVSAAISLTAHFGSAATLAMIRSEVPQITIPGGPRGPTGVQILVGTVEGRINVLPRSYASRLWLGLGPAFVRHGGTAYSRYGSPTSLGAAASLEAVVPLRTHLEWATGATGMAYTIDIPMPPELRLNPGQLEHGNQRDVVFRTGLAWRHR